MAVEVEIGQRNSAYRGITDTLLEPPVRLFNRLFPGVTAKDVTDVGIVLSNTGIHLMENQHRAQKYSPRITKIALGLVLFGMFCDLFDGKLARLIRSEMTDRKKRIEDEKRGQVYDPFADGVIETWQSLESAHTAHKLGRRLGVTAAVFNLATSNIPRSLKAVAGVFGKSVPETYKPYDPRFFGTSLGRKVPNYLSTFVPRIRVLGIGELPLGEISNIGAGLANTEVALERLNAIINSPLRQGLSPKEVCFAGTRAKYLGVQSVVNTGIALVAGRLFRG